MDCQKIDPSNVLRVMIYYTPNGYCWFPAKDDARGKDVFVGTRPQIAAKIKELNQTLLHK